MIHGLPVIDADSHKIENPVLFLDYLDTPFRDRVRQVTDAHGEPRVAITDRNPHTGAIDFVRLYPQPDGFGKGAFRAFHPETALGALFNRVRIEHMDREGIDVQVLYGSLTLTLASVIDGELAVALCRAYNNYIHDDCAPYGDRLIPIGVLPLQDVGEAVAEMRRCVEQLGMAAVTISPNLPMPHPDAPAAYPQIRAPRHLSDPQFFPLYETAQELDCAIGIHGTPGAYLCAGAGDQVDTFALAHVFGHRSQQQMAIAKLVMDGVMERFPRLRFGFLEAGCGWLPDLMHALHEHWEKRVRDFDPSYQPPPLRMATEVLRDRNHGQGLTATRKVRNLLRYHRDRRQDPAVVAQTPEHDAFLYEHRELVRDPIEYFTRGQVFTTFEPDDPAPLYLRAALGDLGERLAGWSVDYGHWDGVLTDCVKRIAEHPQIDAAYATRLLSRNTLAFYGPRLQQRIERLWPSSAPLLEAPAVAPAESTA